MQHASLRRRRAAVRVSVVGTALVASVALVAGSATSTGSTPVATANKYIGAKKCKSCHDSDEMGNQYAAWEKAAHSKAFETLGTPAAKEIASAKGIADPQKADECLKCHTTAFGVDEKQIKKGFKAEMGVQCESCHGPGEDHFKARFKAAADEGADQTPAPGEIITAPAQETCLQCHNSESPTFERFCYYEFAAKIRHARPGSEREALVCGCGECGCTEKCPDDGCGVPQGSK